MTLRNRVRETTTTTGLGEFTLNGALSAGFLAVAQAYSVGERVPYWVVHRTTGEWEDGLGTMMSDGTVARTTFWESSTGSPINFSAGTKDFFVTVSATDLNKMMTVDTIPFASAIPLTGLGLRYMADKVVTGALSLSIAPGQIPGACVQGNFYADGVHAPGAIAGALESLASSGYDNRNGILNVLTTWTDTANAWYMWQQAIGAVAVDTTAPNLTSPTGSQTGPTTASGAVTTDEGNGTLYYVTTTNATETAATVKAGSTQTITSVGTKTISSTGLTPSTTYYHHFLHRDTAGNDSAVVNSASFTTTAVDTTAPTLTSPTGTQTGSTTASGTVSTNEANGTLYYLFSTNATETAATVKGGSSQAVTATGVQNVSGTGLTAATTYYLHFVHRDASGNDSTVANSASFTTSSAAYPRITSKVRMTESGTGPYDYLGTGGSYGVTEGEGVVSTAAQLGVDFELVLKVLTAPLSSTNQVLVGMDDSASLQNYSTLSYCVVNNPSGYIPFTNGSSGSLDAAASGANNDYVRVKRVGSTLTFAVSTNSGGSYTTIKTYTGVPTGVQYLHVLISDAGQCRLISSSGLA